MKVIEAMPVDRFEEILDAGAELLDALRKIMRDRGLSEDDAPAVVCIAAAGALSVSPVPQENFHEMIGMSTAMWRNEKDGTLESIEFDPPHRQEDVRNRPVPAGN